MNKLNPVYLLLTIIAIIGIAVVGSHYGVQDHVTSFALLGVCSALVKLLIDGQTRDKTLKELGTQVQEVKVQTNHHLEELAGKLDIATAKNVQSDLDRAAGMTHGIAEVIEVTGE